jgi:hypothetical protein
MATKPTNVKATSTSTSAPAMTQNIISIPPKPAPGRDEGQEKDKVEMRGGDDFGIFFPHLIHSLLVVVVNAAEDEGMRGFCSLPRSLSRHAFGVWIA